MPIIFPEHVTHAQVVLEDPESQVELISAGFFYVINNQIEVVLDKPAVSLNLKPRPEDKALIESLFEEAGLYAFWEFEN